jgi:CheY-like chemotaxis protein
MGKGGECILVVDDDRDIRDAVVEHLCDHGCAAVGAENGRAALDKLGAMQSEQTCLILLDLMMPVMDGVTFREEQLKQAELATIPVVVLSAFDEVESMQAAGYLRKPFQLDDVLRAARRYCACDV